MCTPLVPLYFCPFSPLSGLPETLYQSWIPYIGCLWTRGTVPREVSLCVCARKFSVLHKTRNREISLGGGGRGSPCLTWHHIKSESWTKTAQRWTASNELCECILPFSPPSNLTLSVRKCVWKEIRKHVSAWEGKCLCVRQWKRSLTKHSDPESFNIL